MITVNDILVEQQDAWLDFTNPVNVTLDFDRNADPVGTAILKKKEDGIYADLTLLEGRSYHGLFPVVGCMYNTGKPGNAEIYELSLCKERNQDKTIPAILAISELVNAPGSTTG
jgi:hypothetical protein